MIYLTGITKANGFGVKVKKFNRLKIPFDSYNLAEKFISSREKKFNCRVYPMYIEK